MLRVRINGHTKSYLVLLVCFKLLLSWPSVGYGAGSDKSSIQSETHKKVQPLNFTASEKIWLKEHPTINIVDDFAWPPYIYQDKNGNMAGIASSYIDVFTKKLGIKFKPQFGRNWEQAIEDFKLGKSDVLPALVRTPEREAFIRFTDPYISFPVVVVTRTNSRFIDSLDDLVGQRVGVVKGYLNEKRLIEKHPDLKVVPHINLAKGLEALADGGIDAFVGNLGVIYFEMHRLRLDMLKIAAPTPYIDNLSLGVRKDWPELVGILNKLIASITAREKLAIKNDWIGVTVEFGTKLSTIIKWTLPALIIIFSIIAFVVIWNRRLEKVVTGRQLAEIAYKHAKESAEKANLAKTSFLANMSHELRTPLNAILGFSRMMSNDPAATQTQLDRLAIVNCSGEHLLGMIDDVLDLSKIEVGYVDLELRSFDLHQLLEDISLMFETRANDAGLSYKLVLEPGLAQYIKLDIGKLRQVLINLLANAVKFTREGYLSLHARTFPMEGSSEKFILQLEVKDSGLGISQEQLKHIFEPFVQVGNISSVVEGSGLGLAITKSVVKIMGGKIEVKSEPEKGTLFTVDLPMSLSDQLEVDVLKPYMYTVSGLEPDQTAWRILVAEDNPDNQLLITELLTQVGFEVQQAKNGKEAVAIFEQWHPHFIWMDLRMPVMDGFEATRKIRSLPRGNDVRIAAMTASVLQFAEYEAIDIGCDDLIRKPFLDKDIFQCMEEQLGVHYIFNESPPRNSLQKNENEETVFSSMNKKLYDTIRKAVESKNEDSMKKAITKLRKINPAMAELLSMLLKDQRYGQILELLS